MVPTNSTYRGGSPARGEPGRSGAGVAAQSGVDAQRRHLQPVGRDAERVGDLVRDRLRRRADDGGAGQRARDQDAQPLRGRAHRAGGVQEGQVVHGDHPAGPAGRRQHEVRAVEDVHAADQRGDRRPLACATRSPAAAGPARAGCGRAPRPAGGPRARRGRAARTPSRRRRRARPDSAAGRTSSGSRPPTYRPIPVLRPSSGVASSPTSIRSPSPSGRSATGRGPRRRRVESLPHGSRAGGGASPGRRRAESRSTQIDAEGHL